MKNNESVRKLIVAATICVALLFAQAVAQAGCNNNQTPSNQSCCDEDMPSVQYVCYADQEGQAGANVYCRELCEKNLENCKFTKPATHGCTSSGSYNQVFKITRNATTLVYKCNDDSTQYHTYQAGGAPVLQGETVKYIIDEDNCGG